MKKILIITMLLLGIIFISFSALADCETGGYKTEFIQMQTDYDGGISIFAQPQVPFEEFLYDRILNRKFDYKPQNIIDISAYRLSLEEAFARIESVTLKNPELMIYTSHYGYKEVNGIVTLVAPQYIYDNITESNAEYAKMDRWIKNFVDSVDKNLSDEEKLLKAYYFVAKNVEYSYGDMLENSDPMIFTAYNAFKNGHCVCQGYVTLMCEILEKLDIKCGVVPSTTINHIWNYVELDGKNYHFDITWDDIDGNNDVVRYWDFLLSDSSRIDRIEADTGIPQTGRNWYFLDEDIICDSTKYESGYIWNWLGVIKNIEECDRGYKGDCLFRLSENEFDTASFVFETIKIPDDEIIMSEITPNGRLFYDVFLKKRKCTSLYIAEYDENNRFIRITRPYTPYLEKSGLGYLPLTKPNTHKINIMWFDSEKLAPLGRNVVME